MAKSLQYPLGITLKMVQAIHAFYEATTRRKCVMDARIEQGWVTLLSAQSLAGEQVTMRDVQIVIRWLYYRAVTDPKKYGPRHIGCLKLTGDNFFNVEKFRQDLSEARPIYDRKRPASSPPPSALRPPPSPPPAHDPKISNALAEFRNQQRRQKP